MISGRVRDTESKKLVAKQMSELGNGIPVFDLKTGAIKSKKAKKPLPPEVEILRELKTLNNKYHVSIIYQKHLFLNIPSLSMTEHVQTC